MKDRLPIVSFKEELVNSVTHGLGLVLSVAGFITLVVMALSGGDVWQITSLTIYGASLTILYAASTLYHSVKTGKWKYYMRIFDHASIYVLIAGSYTPFALVTIREEGGLTLFTVMWVLTLIGIVFKLFFVHKFNFISTILYICMGWMAVLVYEPMLANLPMNGLILLLAGGLLYTGGTIFYFWDKLPFNHGIWHLFVMGGSACHFFAIYYFVLPQ